MLLRAQGVAEQPDQFASARRRNPAPLEKGDLRLCGSSIDVARICRCHCPNATAVNRAVHLKVASSDGAAQFFEKNCYILR